MLWIIFALGAALAWGLYGPALHRGQVALGSPMRALLLLLDRRVGAARLAVCAGRVEWVHHERLDGRDAWRRTRRDWGRLHYLRV